MKRLGLDLGTKTIICASRGDDGKVHFRQEINGFFVLPQRNALTKNILVQQRVPFIERNGKYVALGSRAEKLAYAMNATLRRPMAEGTISSEQEAIEIMAAIVQALIGKLDEDAILYYSIPADAINKDTNVDFHNKIAQLIFNSYKRSNVTINAFPFNEAHAVALAGGVSTGVGCSWGAGMINVCYVMYGLPIFQFSIVGAGDWIDIEVAKAFGYDPAHPKLDSPETPTTVCHRKQQINLSDPLDKMDRVDQAIALHYQILIERVCQGIVSGFEDNIDKARIEEAIPIVIAGGTASPKGFGEYFKKVMGTQQLPFEVSEIRILDKPLYAVAEGCLLAAEMAEEN